MISCRHKFIGSWIGIVISSAMVVWILSSLDLGEAFRALGEADYSYMIAVAVIMIIDSLLRAIRWGSLFDYPHPTIGNRFTALMIGYLGNNLFPARAGQLARIYVLGHRERLSKGTILATVMVEHGVDVGVIFALATLVLMSYPMPAWFRSAGSTLAIVISSGLLFFFAFLIAGKRTVPLVVRLIAFLPEQIVSSVRKAAEDFTASLSSFYKTRKLLYFLCWTILVWAVQLAMILVTAHAFHLNLGILDGLVVLSALGLGTMVPSSPGYVGTYEFFAINALMIVGITGGAALSFALSLHAVMFLAQGLMGLGCMVHCGLDTRRLSDLHSAVDGREGEKIL